MMRKLCLATLLSLLATAALADDMNMCKSLCTSERAQCKRTAQRATELDDLPAVQNAADPNPMARAASQGQLATSPSPAVARGAFEKRKTERTAQCEDTYGRCVRVCAGPAALGKDSDVLTKQGQDKRQQERKAPSPY